MDEDRIGKMTTKNGISDALQICVLFDPSSPRPQVAKLETSERWKRMGSEVTLDVPYTVDFIDYNQWPSVRDKYRTPFWVADASWVMDPLGFEMCLEIGRKEENDYGLLTFSNPNGLAPLARIGAELAEKLNTIRPTKSGALIAELKELAEKNGIKSRDLPQSRFFWKNVTNHAEARRAEWGLLKELQYRPGGLVAQYLNRPLSIPMSYMTMNTWVTPNQTTALAFMVGLVGVIMIFMGEYWYALIGAALLQANSIIDGVDGELARVRHQSSSFGAYLDSVCDEILNALTYAALGYYVWKTGGHEIYLGMGIFAGIMSFLYGCAHWHCKIRHGKGFYWWFDAYKPRKQVQRETSFFFYLKKLFWKESILMIVLLAVAFGFVPVFMWALGAGALLLVILFTIHIPIKRAPW